MNRILSLFDRMRAFVIRDFQLAVSYRLAFLLRLLTILIVVTHSKELAARFPQRFELKNHHLELL